MNKNAYICQTICFMINNEKNGGLREYIFMEKNIRKTR